MSQKRTPSVSDRDATIDVPTRQTLQFVVENLPSPPARILEVGCGSGRLAAALSGLGYDVSAVESDAQAAADARQRGVEVETADWLVYQGDAVDGLIFSRSLHHISPVPDAMAQARRHLHAHGVLLIEDFAFADASAATARFTADLAGMLTRARVIECDDDSFLSRLMGAEHAIEAWHGGHHHIEAYEVVRASVEAAFEIGHEANVPYVFRYFESSLRECRGRTALLEAILSLERAMIVCGAIDAIGRRIVARPHKA